MHTRTVGVIVSFSFSLPHFSDKLYLPSQRAASPAALLRARVESRECRFTQNRTSLLREAVGRPGEKEEEVNRERERGRGAAYSDVHAGRRKTYNLMGRNR